MKVIGLCGGSGSGKGVVCKLFNEFGIDTIDTDKIYHELTSRKSECLDELVTEFGKEILSDGILNRSALRDIVYAEKKFLVLNDITHKHILGRVRELINEYERQGSKGVIVDAPALFESGFDQECDYVICVYAKIETRINRIMERDGLSREIAEKRVYAQISSDWLRDNCDYVIENDSTYQELRISVLAAKMKFFDLL